VGKWVNDVSDVVEFPLSQPPKDDWEKRQTFEAIYDAPRQVQANAHSVQAVSLADLELIRRNGGTRPSEAEVEQHLRDLRKVLLNEQPNGHQTIEDVLPEFEKHLEGRVRNDGLRQKTMDEWLTFVPQFVKTVGNLPLRDIQQKHGREFAKALAAQGKAEKTIKSRLTGVSRLLQFATEEGLLEQNPLNGLKLRDVGTKSRHYRPLNDAQLAALFRIDGLPENVRILWAILITTGMRTDEAALITRNQVRLEENPPNFDLRVAVVKTESSKRQVPIPEVILPTIKRLVDRPLGKDGRLFDFAVKSNGKSRASEVCGYWLRKVDLNGMAPEGPGRFTNHSMRGSLKDKLIEASVQANVSNDLFGHDREKVAGAYGYGTSLRKLKEAVDKIEHPYLRGLALSRLQTH
jgi:integrase